MVDYQHTPVMLPEVLKWLSCFDEKIYIDATIGGGGYAEAILEKIIPCGTLVGIDCDKDAIMASEKRLKDFQKNLILINNNFRHIKRTWEELKIRPVDGVLFDVGVSSFQLEEGSRGFSFTKSGPLDMRLDDRQELKADYLVNNVSEKELLKIFFEYGEERWAKRITRAIIFTRNKKPISTTDELAEIIKKAVPGKFRYGRLHPATRIFQAIRIAVNDELNALKEGLSGALEILAINGRLITLTYHSLEDRIAKNIFREIAKEGRYRVITKKPLRPSLQEIQKNPRSRSAKMRVIERIA